MKKLNFLLGDILQEKLSRRKFFLPQILARYPVALMQPHDFVQEYWVMFGKEGSLEAKYYRTEIVSHHKSKRRQDHRGEKPEDAEIVDASHISYTPPQPFQWSKLLLNVTSVRRRPRR